MLSSDKPREEVIAYIARLARRSAHRTHAPRLGVSGFANTLDEAAKLRGVKRTVAIGRAAESATARMVHAAIQEDTLVEYARAINSLEDELHSRGLPSVTQETFIIFLDHLQKEGASFSSAVKYQAALLHFQLGCRYGLSPGEQPWASRATNPTLKKIFDGIAYKAGHALPRNVSSTGVLDVTLWQQMRSWIDARSDTDKNSDLRLSDGLLIVIHAALRQCEVLTALCRHYDPLTHKLTIVQDKRDSARSAVKGGGHQPLREKWIISPTARRWFEHRVATARDEDYLFDPSQFKVRHMADLVKRAALALKWPQEVKWCFHSARHGGDQTILKLLPEASSDTSDAQVAKAITSGIAVAREALEESAMQQTKATRIRYLASLTARQAALREKRTRDALDQQAM